MKLNLNGWKKVSSHKDHSILKNKDGHELKVVHRALSKDAKGQLEKLEFAEGGQVIKKDDVPEPNKKNAKEMQDGANQSGWEPATWIKNAKQGLGLNKANGGKVQMFADKGIVEADAGADQAVADSQDDPSTAIPVGTLPTTPQPGAPMQLQADPNTIQAQPEAEATPQPTPGQTPAPMDPNSPASAETPSSSYPPLVQQTMDTENKAADVQGKMGDALAQNSQKAADEHQRAGDAILENFKQHQVETAKIAKDIADTKIDENAYWKDHSRALSAIGIALQSFGGQGAAAMDFLHKSIQNNIDAQKANLNKKQTLLGALEKQYGDKQVALGMATAAKAASYIDIANSIAAKSQGPMAKINAQRIGNNLLAQYQPILERASLIDSINKGHVQTIDPASLINKLVKPDQQAKVAAEIEAAQNTKKMSADIFKSFDEAVKENTLLKTMGGLRTPGSVFALHQAMQPTFKDLEGTVRQAAMDNTFVNITPSMGDSAHKTAQRREALEGYVQSKASAPLAKANGIDLSKFNSTRPMTFNESNSQQSTSMNQPTQSKSGRPMTQVNGKWVYTK